MSSADAWTGLRIARVGADGDGVRVALHLRVVRPDVLDRPVPRRKPDDELILAVTVEIVGVGKAPRLPRAAP